MCPYRVKRSHHAPPFVDELIDDRLSQAHRVDRSLPPHRGAHLRRPPD